MRVIGLGLVAAGVLAIGTRDLVDSGGESIPAFASRPVDAGRSQQIAGGVIVTTGLILLTLAGRRDEDGAAAKYAAAGLSHA